MQTPGRHILADFYDCDRARLDDKEGLRALVLEAVRISGAHIISDVFHQFSPQGVTGVVAISESHVSIHTWPELGYAAVDAFTCSDRMGVEPLLDMLRLGLKAGRVDRTTVDRGARIERDNDSRAELSAEDVVGA